MLPEYFTGAGEGFYFVGLTLYCSNLRNVLQNMNISRASNFCDLNRIAKLGR